MYLQGFLSDYGMMWVGEEIEEEADVYNDEPLEELSDAANNGVWEPGINTFI